MPLQKWKFLFNLLEKVLKPCVINFSLIFHIYLKNESKKIYRKKPQLSEYFSWLLVSGTVLVFRNQIVLKTDFFLFVIVPRSSLFIPAEV